ncbi:hypothetical protein DNK10_25585 [Pseudomonas daroniae]|nr:hypothetical protein [Pseudomonas daroniae]TBU71018.1 hypothetical protein DNK10_25585 [Pseudomonas daroniae]
MSDSLMFGTPKERLDFYRREIQYETHLLADRTNAYLAAQSFLVIAYASSMANSNPTWGDLFTLVVPTLLALLGIVNSLHAWPGIRASSAIISHWHFKQQHLLRSEPKFGHAYDQSPLFSEHESSDERYYKSLRFSLRSPWLFTIFWMVLGLFSLWLQLSSTARF